DEVEAAHPLGDRPELDLPGLAHRPGVERGDLVVVPVGGAQEAGRVVQLRHVHRVAVDPVAFQPGPVVGEVMAHRADEDRPQPQAGHAETDVRGDAAAPDLQVVDEEGQRHPVHLVGHELVAEPTGEGHQMIGRDRTGYGDAHGVILLVVSNATGQGYATTPPAGGRTGSS